MATARAEKIPIRIQNRVESTLFLLYSEFSLVFLLHASLPLTLPITAMVTATKSEPFLFYFDSKTAGTQFIFRKIRPRCRT